MSNFLRRRVQFGCYCHKFFVVSLQHWEDHEYLKSTEKCIEAGLKLRDGDKFLFFE